MPKTNKNFAKAIEIKFKFVAFLFMFNKASS